LDEEDMAMFKFGAYYHRDTTAQQIELHKDKHIISAYIKDPNNGYLLNKEKLQINGLRPTIHEMKNIINRGVYNICFELIGGDISVRCHFHIEFQAKSKSKSKSHNSANLSGSNNNNNNSLNDIPNYKMEKTEVPAVEAKLSMAEENLAAIEKEIEYAKQQEILLRSSSEAMTDKIQWFGLLSMGVLVVTSVWQLLYLRSFFTSKKVL
jgi:hypothetical protein